jgi:hypothetical protein
MSSIVAMTKQGKDALTETNPNNFIFHSDYNTFKVVSQGVVSSQTVDANPKIFTLAHGQSGVPAVYAFAKFPDGFVALPNEKERAGVDPVDRYWLVDIDSTNIRFNFYKGSGSNYSVDISYYIFEVPIS